MFLEYIEGSSLVSGKLLITNRLCSSFQDHAVGEGDGAVLILILAY